MLRARVKFVEPVIRQATSFPDMFRHTLNVGTRTHLQKKIMTLTKEEKSTHKNTFAKENYDLNKRKKSTHKNTFTKKVMTLTKKNKKIGTRTHLQKKIMTLTKKKKKVDNVFLGMQEHICKRKL